MALLTDGYQTLIAIVVTPVIQPFGVVFKEKEVTPPALNMGGPIVTTSMRNSIWRTKAPKHLIGVEDVVTQVEYDPVSLGTIALLLGVNGIITVTFPDGNIEVLRGWLEEFKSMALKEGDLPLAEIKLVISNQALGVEVGPTLP